MTRSTMPSFVTELPLQVSPSQQRVLRTRFDVARQVYNACLGETLKRLRLMRQSKAYRRVRKMPKKVWNSRRTRKVGNEERQQLFKQCRSDYKFSDYEVQAYAKQIGHAWLGYHLDSQAIQKLATRAFRAVEQHAYGRRGKPRFKGKNRIRSVEGKSNQSGIRWRDGFVRWMGLQLEAIIPPHDPVIEHGLTCRVKYVRLVKRNLNGRNRYYAQLVNEGLPYRKSKNAVNSGVVGLDIGPSTVAIVAPDADYADLRMFCAELTDRTKEIERLQRKRSRQERANNPANFETDRWVKKDKHWHRKKGKVKKGAGYWNKSGRQRRIEARLAEVQRKQAAYRKSLHGRLINELLAMGDEIQIEKLSYRALQKKYGKSVGNRAPGMFVEMLRRKAANAGGVVYEFPTRSTRLSQTCHGCGTIKKKSLKQRWHNCDCGVKAQRDLYSAFMACCVEDDRLIAAKAKMLWPGVETRLRTAMSRTGGAACTGHLVQSRGTYSIESMSGGYGFLPASFGVRRSRNGSSGKSGKNLAEACDVVADPQGKVRAHERPEVFRTPRL